MILKAFGRGILVLLFAVLLAVFATGGFGLIQYGIENHRWISVAFTLMGFSLAIVLLGLFFRPEDEV